jgi:hypothetical protein
MISYSKNTRLSFFFPDVFLLKKIKLTTRRIVELVCMGLKNNEGDMLYNGIIEPFD